MCTKTWLDHSPNISSYQQPCHQRSVSGYWRFSFKFFFMALAPWGWKNMEVSYLKTGSLSNCKLIFTLRVEIHGSFLYEEEFKLLQINFHYGGNTQTFLIWTVEVLTISVVTLRVELCGSSLFEKEKFKTLQIISILTLEICGSFIFEEGEFKPPQICSRTNIYWLKCSNKKLPCISILQDGRAIGKKIQEKL